MTNKPLSITNSIMIWNTYLVHWKTRELTIKLIAIRDDISKWVFLVEWQKIEMPLERIQEWTLLGNDTNG